MAALPSLYNFTPLLLPYTWSRDKRSETTNTRVITYTVVISVQVEVDFSDSVKRGTGGKKKNITKCQDVGRLVM